ncbi:hypothetical protein MVLG_03838 [Microbotryum lychnidis-dioicae p1A1 Lamole]|uniref:Uncharacterized protein n=1 Tax=Microbotryum lychnidis-dioicae (strain p1A1 Lamole / MvSl-1064) TaxID=683840 RepID=U5H9E6_USTV1|nr:hypothetical protein MVLG_03838 [Microbotryum lychnidis-dioicae p1A1 Lamole]|eukprot:KDE05746.1 hypothetical protein MVLG_03838 [Microbotryum lychnidis-dioicae p1A1 Lamole]
MTTTQTTTATTMTMPTMTKTMFQAFLGWLSDRHSEERTGASASVVHDKSSQPEWDDDWMPYFRPSKTEGATERIFDAAEFRNKNLHLKFPSVDWSEARLVGEGDPEWGMEYLSPPSAPARPPLSVGVERGADDGGGASEAPRS